MSVWKYLNRILVWQEHFASKELKCNLSLIEKKYPIISVISSPG